ncbi:iron ABC transporter ATP-binding protein [Agromyces mangrovi Wang et al. 2018]|uniref:iron ABC transporter ATP-binding protein n=1 Tax=Agromyces mangrovi TaxID=1858653 RepID=UPI00257350F5|nr:iron ABC transporter ATP-binding protein [Agromyces mangrovi]
MPARPTRLERPLRLLAVPLVAAAVVVGLAACAPEDTTASPTPAPEETTAQSEAPEETDAATPTPTPTPTGEPVGLACDELLTLDQMYAFNPNYGTDPGYAPTGEPAVFSASIDGVACGWLNQSSGETIEVSVARPVGDTMEVRLNEAVLSGQAVPTYGTPPEVEGYYGRIAGVGTAQAFADGYWVTAASVAFFEPGDAQPLVEAMLANVTGG